MDDTDSTNRIPHYPVRIWEGILILLSAIGVVGIGITGLCIKALNNAFDPARAEAVAQSLLNYEIPGGSQGVFGIKFGGARLAWVRSVSDPPDVTLFVGITPVNKETSEEDNQALKQDFETPPSDTEEGQFTASSSRTETKQFCGQVVPVTIELGQQTFSNQPNPLEAIRYTLSTKADINERLVILTVNGADAPSKAEQIFNSLRCRQESRE